MPSSAVHGRKRRFPFAAPALASALLLLLLAGGFYRLYDLNLRDTPQNTVLLKEELARRNALKEELARLEGWIDKTPCEVKTLLQGASLSPALLPQTASDALDTVLLTTSVFSAAAQNRLEHESAGGQA